MDQDLLYFLYYICNCFHLLECVIREKEHCICHFIALIAKILLLKSYKKKTKINLHSGRKWVMSGRVHMS
jgi:hypothetical protein